MHPTQSLHTHTVFSDGDHTPREMIEAAIELGMEEIGFTDHSYTFFDEGYCLKKEQTAVYLDTVRSLKEEYRGKIAVKLGMEQDYASGFRPGGLDYAIGSVHYVKALDLHPEKKTKGKLSDGNGSVYFAVDESIDLAADILMAAAEDCFAGDIYSLIEAYYLSVGDVIRQTGADIIGHFDVITKCNTMHPIFDTEHPRYKKAWMRAADELLLTGKPFEINVSPILRGIKKEPYPSLEMQEYIRKKGGSFLVTGDCHSIDELVQFHEMTLPV